MYFMAWGTTAKKHGGGGGGKDWVEKHIHSFVNIAGTLLGVPKAVPALLSGELKDTAVLLNQFGVLLEQYFGRRLRHNLWTTWGSLFAMLPKGGNTLWPSPMIHFNDTVWSTQQTIDYILQSGGGHGPTLSSSQIYSKPKQWHDPTTTPLPKAPSLRIYCMYGTGIPTESAYYYKPNTDTDDNTTIPYIIDNTYTIPHKNITNGVKFTDGDGSVPLLSLGYMCQHWKTRSSHNPSKATVIVREFLHEEEFTYTDPTARGGPHSSEHVDILGNHQLMEDVLKIVTDFEPIQDQVVSDIDNTIDPPTCSTSDGQNCAI